MKKQISLLVAVIIAVVVGGSAFYGGMVYGQSQGASRAMGPNAFANLTPEQRQARGAQFGANGGVMRGAGGFSTGEVLSKDDKSFTLKLTDGGSKIIFYSTSTPVTKSSGGSLADVVVGEQVSVNGTPNSDGSLNAQGVQIRPAMPVPAAK